MSQLAKIDIDGALSHFGLAQFRPGQRDVISHVVQGESCLCVMPTGGGKSLCYQLPTLVRPGLTIVVSPLIALMKDQVDSLEQRGIPATLINSSISIGEQQTRLQQVAEGKYRLLYVAPERLRNQRFLEAIRATPVQLLAIDEAHCISQWGHDFRPDYARLGKFREFLGGLQTIALTATATQRVRQDILDILGMKNARQFITGFARTNLHFGVVPCQGDRDKINELKQFLENRPGSGIVYAATRKRCEELVTMIAEELRIPVGTYHAGLTPDQRRAIQDRFMSGQLEVIVATNAFGMGIDKPDLRFVVHFNMPGSLEAYYQEAGRAGRDGLPSTCVLLYSYQDRFIQEFFIENNHPPAEIVKQVYEFLLGREEDPIELTQQEIRDQMKVSISAEAIGTCMQLLARTHVIDRLEAGGGLAAIQINSDLPTLVDLLPREARTQRKVMRLLERAVGDRRHETVFIHPRWLEQESELEHDSLLRALREVCQLEMVDYVPPFRGRATHFRRRDLSFEQLGIDFEQLRQKKQAELDKLDQVIQFAQTRRCRQLAILEYFGDPKAAACKACDRCQGRTGWPIMAPSPATAIGKSKERVSKPDVAPAIESDLPAVPPILNQVLAAIQRLHGRLGKQLIAQFLTGSQNVKVQRLRLQRLDAFGMLEAIQQTQATKLLDEFLRQGILAQQEVNAHRPTVHLAPLGEAILARQEKWPELNLAKPLLSKLHAISGSSVSTNPSAPSSADKAVVRKSAANRTENPVETPGEQERDQPEGDVDESSPEREIPVKASAKAAKSVTAVASHAVSAVDEGRSSVRNPTGGSAAIADPSRSDLSPPGSQATSVREVPIAKPDWYWTWRLLQDGYSVEHCQAIRRKSREEMCHDLRQSLANGRPLNPRWFRVGSTKALAGEMVAAAGTWPDWLPEDLRNAMTANEPT